MKKNPNNKYWVDCKKQLPEEVGTCLAYTTDGVVVSCSVDSLGTFNVHKSTTTYKTTNKYHKNYQRSTKVAYWMPVPLPPEKEKKSILKEARSMKIKHYENPYIIRLMNRLIKSLTSNTELYR